MCSQKQEGEVAEALETKDGVYPTALLPSTDYVEFIRLSDIYPTGQYYTQRRVTGRVEDHVDKFGNVMESALGVEWNDNDHITGMSVNMMGTPHLPEYGKWTQSNPASKHWDAKEVDFKKYAESCKFNRDQEFVYLNATNLEGITIPHKMYLANQEIHDLYKDVAGIYGKQFASNYGYDVVGTIRHIHTPTFANYWHAEIWMTHLKTGDDYQESETIDEYGRMIKFKGLKEKPEWKQTVKHLFVASLLPNVLTELPSEYSSIPSSHYLSN